ncbi:acetoacetyl-CoA synthetase-like, partial [Stegodyphus dumicola]|uniref:acetoacetyl-CoA synthetase-like n=1 Tax=Stegodyphus dumicola TaxID=202533 RepID=UPI0015ACF89A
KPYTVPAKKKGDEIIDVEWFPGAELNYAENILRYRDDTVALICVDEDGQEERVTFAEMYEEVKLYAAAFKKGGLQKGDRVACYMSNRKEAIFAMLAATSMGALFGGPLPFYGAKVT